MFSPFLIPIACFVMVILVVAIVEMVKLREKEIEVRQKLYLEELEHRRRMQELENEASRLMERG